MTADNVTAGVAAFRCAGCGALYFPPRLLCARCGGAAFEAARVTQGVIEEITIIRHVLGQKDWGPRRIRNSERR